MKERDFVAPQAPELEEAVLGACLIERTAMPQVDGMLKPEMFYDTRHQLIFAALQAMYRTGANIDILTAAEELRRRGQLEVVGGAFRVTQLSSRVASSAHLEFHARIVHQKYIRREMIVGFNKLLAASYDESIDIDDTLVEAHNLTDRLEGQCGHDTRLRNMDTLMRDTLAQAAGRIERCREGMTGIPTGLTDLDRMTAGWQNGDLTVIAARPSVGKTAFALHLALAAARAGHAVVVYSLEMLGERLGDRWLVSAGKTNAYLWKSGKLSAEEFAEAQQTSAELARLPIHVDDSPDMSMDKVRSSARLLKSRGQCGLIIVDYLQLCDMQTTQANRNREQEVAQASRRAKLLAKELDVPVILLSQLNRMSERTGMQRPELSQLRESGAIEQDADQVMLLYRPALAHIATDKESGYPTEGLGIVIVAKHRNGETGNVYFGHNRTMTQLGDYVPPLEWMKKNAK